MQLRDLNRDKYLRNLANDICDLRSQHYAWFAGTGCDCVCYDCCILRKLKLATPNASPEELFNEISEIDPIQQRAIFNRMKRYLEKKTGDVRN